MTNIQVHPSAADEFLTTLGMRMLMRQEDQKIDYAEHPDQYLSMLGYTWGKMIDIALSVRDNKYTIVRAANGVSKTYTACALALWWFDTFRPDCKVITTANTYSQMRFVMWARMRDLYNKVAYRFDNADMNTTDFTPDSKEWPDWYMLGLSPEIKAGQATAFSGHHTKTGRVLFIYEECISIPPPVYEAGEGSLRSNNARFLGLLNPTAPIGVPHQWEIEGRVSKEKGNLIEISAFDLFNDPNYEQMKTIEGLQTPEGAQDLIDIYGEESAIVQSRVYARYPKQDKLAAISLKGCEEARQRKLQEYDIGEIIRIILSWDVAGEGADRNVIGLMLEGLKGVEYEVKKDWLGDDIDENVEIVDRLLTEIHDEWIFDMQGYKKPVVEFIYDATGEGSYAVTGLKKNHRWVRFIPFKGGEAADPVPELKTLDIFNKISEAWLRAQLLIDRNEWLPLVCEFDQQTRHQLTTRRTDTAPRKKQPQIWSIESKRDYKDRNSGKSPDHADAFVMAAYILRAKQNQWGAA